MQASTIINDQMSLDQKLEAIDKAMAEFEAKHKAASPDVPVDPSEALLCIGCQ